MKQKMVFNDFSALKKTIIAAPPAAPRPKPAAPAGGGIAAAARDPRDLFARMMGGGPAAAVPPPAPAEDDELEAEKAALDKLAEKLAAADAAREELAAALAAAQADKTALAEENARLRSELDRARSQARPAAAEDPEVRLLNDALDELSEKNKRLKLDLAAAQAAPAKALLVRPEGVEEVFPREIREHVLSALADAADAARNGARERRAALLAKVLAANAPDGALAERRAGVKKAILEAGKFIDGRTIQALEKLGFRDVSNNKHHKLRWADLTITLANTPSDHRSADNAAAEINNRAF